MSITNTMLEAFMQLTSARQERYSYNMANVNTPGFLSEDISIPKNFAELVRSSTTSNYLAISMTNPMHITSSKPSVRFKSYIDLEGGELKPNGNNVDIASQAKKASQNASLYETALKAYSTSTSLIDMAVGKGR
jgi:flagellar basal-body rod protein FlgB